jgi:hypothetical protein
MMVETVVDTASSQSIALNAHASTKETCITGVTHVFIGDGVCNDETNIAECEFDGGDCCTNPNMVGDGICNDETNRLGCNYDGGDCCGPAVSCKSPCFFDLKN